MPIKEIRQKRLTWLFSIAICLILMLHYYLDALAIPYETTFDFLPVIDEFKSGTLTLESLMYAYAEHGMFGYCLLLLLNAQVFALSGMFEALITIGTIALFGILYICCLKESLKDVEEKDLWLMFYAGVTISAIAAANNNFSLGMSIQVRFSLLFSLIVAICVSNVLIRGKSWWTAVAVIMIFLGINVFGTMYSFALAPVMLLIVFGRSIYLFRHKKRGGMDCMLILGAYLSAVVLYLYQYKLFLFAVGGDGGSSGRLFATLLEILMNPWEMMQGLLGWCASGILGWQTYASPHGLSYGQYLIVGFLLLILYAYAGWRFFRSRMYMKTWVPLFMMGYSVMLLGILMIGRPLGKEWFLNSWYTIHAKSLPIGCVWILFYDCMSNLRGASVKIRRGMAVVSSIVILVGVTFGFRFTLGGSLHTKKEYEQALPYLYAESIEELQKVTVNGLTPLFATPEATMRGIDIMRKYNLGVYRYENAYLKYQYKIGAMTGSTLETASNAVGFYADSWIASDASLELQTKNKGQIVIQAYYPLTPTGNEKITILVDGQIACNQVIEENSFQMTIYAPQNQIVSVQIQAPFSGKSSNSVDGRDLAFLITELYAE